MTKEKKVKIQNFIETQIPDFLNLDNPLFKEFLEQYYISVEHQTGIVDLTTNLLQYKDLDNFNKETFYNQLVEPCVLTQEIQPFDVSIKVNSTIGFPNTYGLFKINNEIITYTDKTETSFEGCIRGFSGIDNISSTNSNTTFNFNITSSDFHPKDSEVKNLNTLFFNELFKKFKYQFIPGFEGRSFIKDINVQGILLRAKDFYTTKGTDISYQLLFKILYGTDVELIKPQDYMLRPSDNKYFITKNILVEKLSGELNPLDLRGEVIQQKIPNSSIVESPLVASASIYNVQFRPVDGKFLYEISLDPETLILEFTSTKKTYVIEETYSNTNVIIVDSTIGFPESGTLYIQTKNSIEPVIITYTGKTINEFLNIGGLKVPLSKNDVIIETNFAFVNVGTQNATFRIINIIEDLDYGSSSSIKVGDVISLSSFGVELNEIKEFSEWLYNIPSTHKIKSIRSNISDIIYTVELYDNVKFILEEDIILNNLDDQNSEAKSCQIVNIIDLKTIEVLSFVDILDSTHLSKTIKKADFLYYPEINTLSANIKNTYIDSKQEFLYVASSGIPDYQVLATDRKVEVSTAGIGATTIFDTNVQHNFYSGEEVYFTPSINSGLSTGTYYVSFVGNRKLSISHNISDVFSKKNITIPSNTSGQLVKIDYKNKIPKSQNLFKKIPLNKEKNKNYSDTSTINKPIGILVNGVEIYSNTLYDQNIYYGQLDSIDVLSTGDGYDVINPPEIEILDTKEDIVYGSGAKAHANIVGSIKGVRIIDPGYGYDDKIKLSLTGGNGTNVELVANVEYTKITSGFIGDFRGVDPTENTITFILPHNFVDGDVVEYLPNGNIEISFFDPVSQEERFLSSNSLYYVGVVSEYTIKLYSSEILQEINEIDLVISQSTGVHNFRTIENRLSLTNVYVKNSGENFSNKRVIIPSVSDNYGEKNGINLIDNYIYAKNHNFNEKDIIVYSTTGTEISGISTTSKYHVNVIDKNKFRVSFAGNTDINDEDYNSKKFVRFNSLGQGTHTFSYPPIGIEITVSSETSSPKFKLPILQPIVTGKIESIFIESFGSKYGTPDIINYHRRPNVFVKSPQSEAILKPKILNGKIVDVQILSSGRGYLNDADVVITGSGKFANIYPIIQNGRVVSIIIVNGGIGYDNKTDIKIKQRGTGVDFLANVSEWKINQIEKNKQFLNSPDEGILVPSRTDASVLQFIHFYPPKILRMLLGDNITSDGKESELPTRSPILGWSYDGFPIYGPYTPIDGKIRPIRSSYELNVQQDLNLRPSRSIFPDGIFVQDYVFNYENGDGLDEYNGKFIVNEDYPNGTYAYFYTIKNDSGNNSVPTYPYVISNNFKFPPEQDNYNPNHNQNMNLAGMGLIRNTSPYYLNSAFSSYEQIDIINKKYKQEFIVNSIQSSGIDSIEIYSGGDNYKVGDSLVFQSTNSVGTRANATVSSISGKDINSINIGVSTFSSVRFEKVGRKVTGISSSPVSFISGEYVSISGITKFNYKFLEGNKKIDIFTRNIGITTNISSIIETGNITKIYPDDIRGFEINDFIKIDDEILKILQIFPTENSFLVQRLENTGPHIASNSRIELLPRKFVFFDSSSDLNTQENTQVYFNPETDVAVGNTSKAYNITGLTTTTIPEKSIYIPNHQYITGQALTYNSGIDGIPLLVANNISGPYFQINNNQTIYVVNNGPDFIAITTGIGTSYSPVFFSEDILGYGKAHTLTTTYDDVFGDVENYSLFISTSEPHQLGNDDKIEFNLKPNLIQTTQFKYDEILKKIVLEPVDFDSSQVDLATSSIEADVSDFKTGDKVVYYTNGNSGIGGVENNKSYFIIKENDSKLKLALYYSDALAGKYIEISSPGSGTHSFSKLNPKIEITKGNTAYFELDDPSLENLTLKLYKDSNFRDELDTYFYRTLDGKVYIDTSQSNIPNVIYYKFISSSSIVTVDDEVIQNNSIETIETNYNNEYTPIIISNNEFKINLLKRPENLEYTLEKLINLNYTTKSQEISGPIDRIKVNYGGKNYTSLPKISDVISTNGSGAILKAKSNKIGRIESTERVKDGFDYPTDPTLLPRMSVPAIVEIGDISRIDYVGIVSSGKNYNTPPSLKVIGNDRIKLEAITDGNSIVSVNIVENTNDLSAPLRVVPTRNSNGYSIDDIVVNGNIVTLELLNSDIQKYPLISTGYGKTDFTFPFEEGDQIFIERCRVNQTKRDENGELITQDNYNSSDYNYRFFTVIGVNTTNYTVTYSMSGVKNNLDLGDYTSEFGYGYVVNRKDMAEFEMIIIDDLSYISDETVLGFNKDGTNTFSAKVMKNGWTNEINELRLIDVLGELSPKDKLVGDVSKLSGSVVSVNIFNLKSKVGTTRNKLNDLGDRIGFLNDYYQRISDNNYYQKFAYSIKGEIPYNVWKEPVRSLIHPSGFKEFSDLSVVSIPDSNLRVATDSNVDITVNIDNEKSMYTKNNFALVTEDEQFEDGSIERIVFEEGTTLTPYFMLNSNKVSIIDDISPEFDGTAILEVITNKSVSFISTDLYRLGVSTEGLSVGDKIGFSTYHYYPDSTYIFNIGDGYIQLNQNTPHRLLSDDGSTITVVENLDFYRRVPGSKVVGKTNFKLKNNGTQLFFREFDNTVGLIQNSAFNLPNHNFQTGQQLIYSSNEDPIVAIAATNIGSGAVLSPVFDDNYSIVDIKVIDGGLGYSSTNLPSIEILGTNPPLEQGIFTPSVDSLTGVITSITITDPGFGYYPLSNNAIGIKTTSQVEVRRDIVMGVGGGIGSAIYEMGYNVAITTSITGITSSVVPDFSGDQTIFWGFDEPYIPAIEGSGTGIGAKFTVFNVYNSSTGQPISTSIILRDGGRGYSVGDVISIAGTYMGGSTPGNDLSFTISRVSSTRVSGSSGITYTNIPGETLVGYGTGASFNISRNSSGDIGEVVVIDGGKNYTITDNISIAGTYIGGITPNDNLLLSPTILGTDKLPNKVYVRKINKNKFELFGTLTGSRLEITNSGIGTNSFELLDKNVNTLIAIDNIIQTPLTKKNSEFTLERIVEYSDDIIYLNESVDNLKLNDVLKIENELIKIKNIGVDGENSVSVERGSFGTQNDLHNTTNTVYVLFGDYNIVKDNIIFTSAPYGPTGLPGLEINSSFSGRAFSRRFDPNYINDKNIIFDDISEQFIGTGSTNFILKYNGESVVGIYTNTNSIIGTLTGEDINNNPIILINNIVQVSGVDYIIDTPMENTLRFVGGAPLSGKILSVGVNTGFGYQPLVGASATVSVSSSGQIINVALTGSGGGYREPPTIQIISQEGGSGGILTTTVGVGGTITSISILNSGSGYSQSSPPVIKIEPPQNYYNLDLVYANGQSGDGQGAKGSIVISNNSTIKSFVLEAPGNSYKNGDILTISGITTIPNSTVEQFEITVTETFTDKFNGWYPGQFIQVDDISRLFNGFRRRFNITTDILGKSETLNIKTSDPTDIIIANNFFIFINDILQVPNESYTIVGSRIVFKEAPKANSKCNIIFYKGSDLDIEFIEPPKTIKEGDTVKIDENRFDKFDRPQFDRIVKNIVSMDVLDTFPYLSIGISTDQTKIRPLHWTKQTKDRIINGVLYSKSRPSLKSRVTPFAYIISDIDITDTKVYVDSAAPLFEDIDETLNIGEELRDVIIVDDYDFGYPELVANVSYAGTVSSIDIINPGYGYKLNTAPTVNISIKTITTKDPILNWNSQVGIVTTSNFNSIHHGDDFVAVGSDGITAYSSDGNNWNFGPVINSDYKFNDVVSDNDTYVAVGSSGLVYSIVGLTTNINWERVNLYDISQATFDLPVIIESLFVDEFNSVLYNSNNDTLIVVGDNGGIFTGIGIGTTALYRNTNQNFNFNFNSIASNELLTILVADSGKILYSEDSFVWQEILDSTTTSNLLDVIWTGNEFISVGDSGTILSSTNGFSWGQITNNLGSLNITKITYNENIYVIVDSFGKLHYSLDLEFWEARQISNNVVLDIVPVSEDTETKYISVGSTGFISYSTPTFNRATAVATIDNGEFTEITITNGGFGYSQEIPPLVITESELCNKEQLFSIKAKGDFGTITDVVVYSSGNVGFSTSAPAIEFTLKSDNYPNLITQSSAYTPIEVGDYFIIRNSNVVCGHALTGITTSLGGLSNYPQSRVGVATTFIDGIYKAENVISDSLGISTVRCFFYPVTNVGPDKIFVDIGTNTSGFYGNYSFGIIYDYQNRAVESPKTFTVNKDDGLLGITTGPLVYRTRSIN